MAYHHLTREERYLMAYGLSRGWSEAEIARQLGRSRSTISRERRRNASKSDGCYRHEKADSYARARRRRSRQGTQYDQEQVREVHRRLACKWSPQQISGRFGLTGELRISTSTIYRWIRQDKARGGGLWERTRRLAHRYRKGYRVKDHRGRLQGKVPLSERPAQANDRSEHGHWEGDTVMGKDGRHCLLTLVERKTRRVRIIKLRARQAVEVNKAMTRLLNSGALDMKSLTLDNGTEFHGYAQWQERFGIGVYFAAPYHSWERGTNENTNGLIRQYLPKGTCFKELTQRQCDAIETELNDRPRKTLGYRTPAEAYDAERCT
jgi:transposase, IS30 family